jgi:2-polyprenyl-3-methyl-5-hydroxy-6-metoxy-1,4-benzoquinol methylase
MKLFGRVGEYEQWTCGVCGHVHFIHDSNKIKNALYEADTDYNDDLSVANDFEDFILWSHNKALQYMHKKYPAGKADVLDVGCFNGFFVKKLLKSGFNARGIDFNNIALDFGKRQYGLEKSISNETLRELIAQGLKFDIITLFEVIEHLEDIGEVLTQVAALLKERGVVIVSTPNSRMCWRPALDFPPHHLSRFTPNALRRCVAHFGFQPISLHEQMSSYDLFRHYLGTLFRAKNKSSLRGGSLKRNAVVRGLRITANKFKRVAEVLLFPIDSVLYTMGFRYICQVVIAKKQ